VVQLKRFYEKPEARLIAYLIVVALAIFLVWRGEQTRQNDIQNAKEARVALAQQVERARLRERRRDARIRTNGRAETCRAIDADHDRERARIVDGERQLYGPFRGILPLTLEQTERLHQNNVERYNEVVSTRPRYCPPRKPIKPYPSIEELGGP
jgi:type II secretory pathway pseudopilin PulG